MLLRLIAFCLLIGFELMPALAEAANCGNLGLTVSNVTINWNENFNFQTVNFTVTNDKSACTAYSVTFTAGQSGSYTNRYMLFSSTQLVYQLYKDSNLTQVLKDGSGLTSSNYLTGSFPGVGSGTQSQSQTYYVQIPQASATTPTYKVNGTYADSFTIKVFSSSPPSGGPKATSPVNISTIIPKFLDISLVGTGVLFDVNQTTQNLSFGTLSAGLSQGFDLLVRTNAGYSVSLSSQYNGTMHHATPSITTTVPYTLSVNSSSINLSTSHTTPVVVATGSGQTSTSGVRNPVAVVIGSIDQSVEGSYSDNITVTAATQ